MTFDEDSPSFDVRVGGRTWHVGSEFAEYDATHAVAGALLAGADEVTVTRVDDEDDEERRPNATVEDVDQDRPDVDFK